MIPKHLLFLSLGFTAGVCIALVFNKIQMVRTLTQSGTTKTNRKKQKQISHQRNLSRRIYNALEEAAKRNEQPEKIAVKLKSMHDGSDVVRVEWTEGLPQFGWSDLHPTLVFQVAINLDHPFNNGDSPIQICNRAGGVHYCGIGVPLDESVGHMLAGATTKVETFKPPA